MEKELLKQEENLFISNEDMSIIKIIKSSEDSGVLLDGVTKTVKQKGGFLGALLTPLARLKQHDFVRKTDFDNKLTSFNRTITSNKTKHLEVQKKLNSLITKDYKFFLVRIYFTSNNGSQNICIYQPTLDTLELKKDKY